MDLLTHSELEQLIVVMRNMERAAIDEDWLELTHLDEYRRELLQYNVKTKVSTDKFTVQKSVSKANSRHADLVNEILHLDLRIINTVITARSKLLAENRGLSAQVNAKANYALTSQFS